MAVPEIIRNVKRPKGSVVLESRNKGIKHFVVRNRDGYKRVKDGNPKPINGETIGYIDEETLSFIKREDVSGRGGLKNLFYGIPALFKSLTTDLYSELLSFYSVSDASTMMAVAGARFWKSGIPDYEVKHYYDKSFLSLYYPNASTSPSSISKKLYNIGMDEERRDKFFSHRAEKVCENHHVLIDGMLQHDDSYINDLSEYTKKERTKGRKDISILTAYDAEEREPICSHVYSGNLLDLSVYKEFVSSCDIKKGIIIDDKGFPVNKIEEWLEDNKELHFITPIKRNSKLNKNNDAFRYDGKFEYEGRTILYKKVKLKGGHFLYSFKDLKKAGEEEVGYYKNHKDDEYNDDDRLSEEEKFGTISIESDLDEEAEVIYSLYHTRWEIELVFNTRKNISEIDTTRENSEFSIYGSELVNFIVTYANERALKKAEDVGYIQKHTYGSFLDGLESWRSKTSYSLPVFKEDSSWSNTTEDSKERLYKLGIIKSRKDEKKERRRD